MAEEFVETRVNSFLRKRRFTKSYILQISHFVLLVPVLILTDFAP
jgi:hypothetical protein